MFRYKVRYNDIVWKRQLYEVGTLMPIEFDERELRRHLNSRRFEAVVVKEEKKAEVKTVNAVVPPAQPLKNESTSQAGQPKAVEVKTTAPVAPAKPATPPVNPPAPAKV